jgi:signal transduction histidine kinase
MSDSTRARDTCDTRVAEDGRLTAPVILVVDDVAANRLVLEAVLATLSYTVVTAASGEEAIRRLGEHRVVLIVMDAHMPGLDGYETTARIRREERWRDIPIMFLTAVYEDAEHRKRGYALGAVDYISKPFDPDVLRAKVGALVSLYTLGERAERSRREEAERLQDLFLGTVGHDLRNPLSAILLASKMILDDRQKERHGELARRIVRAGQRMQRMLENVLDLTRRNYLGTLSLSPRATDLGEVCRAVVDEQRLGHPDRVVQLEAGGDVRGEWDPDAMGRVVSNLVGNALDHQPGPVLVRVVGHQDDHVALEVRNGGTPIDPKVLPSLFEPFRRGATAANGLGLGLYIVREIVQAHQGSVNVSSSTDGTTFTVRLSRTVPGRPRAASHSLTDGEGDHGD